MNIHSSTFGLRSDTYNSLNNTISFPVNARAYRENFIRNQDRSPGSPDSESHEWNGSSEEHFSERVNPSERSNQSSKKKTVKLEPVLSEKQRVALTGSGQYWHHGVLYASCSEAACAELMERYIPGFKSKMEETFQIIVYDYNKGTHKTVDFFVKGCMFEFHPPRFWKKGKRYGDFKNASQYFEYRHKLRSIKDPSKRKAYKELTRLKLAHQYYGKRKQVLTSNPLYRETELILATCAEEVYENVITRFGRGYPSKARFVKQFEKIRRQVKNKNSSRPETSSAHSKKRDRQRGSRPYWHAA